VGNRGIGLLRGQRTDQFHHASGCPPQIRRIQRQGSLYLRRGAALPADLDVDHTISQQCDVLDEQP
jgi:hypothetical protein